MRLQNMITNVATGLADEIIRSGQDLSFCKDVPVTVCIITDMSGEVDCIYARVGFLFDLSGNSYFSRIQMGYSDLISSDRSEIIAAARVEIEAALRRADGVDEDEDDFEEA